MRLCTGFFAKIVLPATLIASVPFAGADDNTELIGRLDALDRTMAESTELVNRTQTTIDTLRKNLYDAAVRMRDLKNVGDEIDVSKAKDADLLAQHALMKEEIAKTTATIREIRDRLLELENINSSGQDKLKAFDKEISLLTDAVVDPEKAAQAVGKKKIAALEARLDEANQLADQRGKALAKLDRELKEMQKGSPVRQDVAPKVNTAETKALAAARNALDAGNIDDALVLYNKLMYEYPDSDAVRLGLAACYFERGELGTATGIIDEVLSRDKLNAWALGLQGAVLFREGKLRNARKSLEKSIKLDENNAYTHNYLGVVLHQMDKKAEGLASIQKSLQLDPEYIPALYNAAVMMASADVPDLDASRYYYSKAISLGSPRDPLMDQLLNLSP